MAGVRLPEDHQEPTRNSQDRAASRGRGDRRPLRRRPGDGRHRRGDGLRRRRARGRRRVHRPGYGPLVNHTGEMSLPAGFRVTASAGRLADVRRDSDADLPRRHDLRRRGDGRVRLLRNHEGYDLGRSLGPVKAYDRVAQGGVTPRSSTPGPACWSERSGPERHRQQLQRRPDAVGQLALLRGVDGRPAGGLREEARLRLRGAVASREPVDPVPIKAMGRFEHEACAIDPRSGIVYMTEDNGDPADGFYRYIPDDPGKLDRGGKLQMLAVEGAPATSPTSARRSAGRCSASGSTSTTPIPSDAEDHPDAVFEQGVAKARPGSWASRARTGRRAACTSSPARPATTTRARSGATRRTGITKASSSCSTSRAARACSTSPTASRSARAAASWSARTATARTSTAATTSSAA